jgi:hypothetical protein
LSVARLRNKKLGFNVLSSTPALVTNQQFPDSDVGSNHSIPFSHNLSVSSLHCNVPFSN